MPTINARRLKKKALAAQLGISRVTLDEYLNRKTPPPPKPDKAGAYSVDDVAHYIEVNGAKAVSTEEMRRLREALLRMDVEERAIQIGIRKGEIIERAKVRPGIEAVMGRLTADLQAKFEQELPSKYGGRTGLQCAELNAAAVDWVLRRMKEGWANVA